jgi:glycerol-3-phosphate dehydrogenase (NAD(P)+)
LASINNELSKKLQTLLNNSYFRVYSSDDIVGVEIAGALKNIIAIASGISDGLNLGYNAKASLITRGLAEIMKFGLYFGAKKETFMGLAGVGDLVLTCTGNLSRNRKVGFEIVKRGNLNDVLSSMIMVAEGVNTTKSVFEWSLQNGIDMPISNGIYDILYNKKDPKNAVRELMERPLKSEF